MRGAKSKAVLVAIVAVALLTAFALGGCTKKLTKEEYEDAVKTALEGIADAGEDMEDSTDFMNDLDFDEELGKDNLGDLKDAFGDFEKTVKGVRDDFKKYAPPSEYEDIHEDVQAGLDGFVKIVAAYSEVIDELKSDSTLEDVFEGLTDAMDDLQDDLEDTMEDFAAAAEELGLEDEFYEVQMW
jgi:hypothetical protein